MCFVEGASIAHLFHYSTQRVRAAQQFVFAMKIKTFVRNVACFPERITAPEFRDFSTMRPDEKLHIAMLAAEARKQAALLYGLRAVMNHMR